MSVRAGGNILTGHWGGGDIHRGGRGLKPEPRSAPRQRSRYGTSVAYFPQDFQSSSSALIFSPFFLLPKFPPKIARVSNGIVYYFKLKLDGSD